MKTSKPFAFVLWADGAELPHYVLECLRYMEGFRWMHYIHHDAEPEPAPLISRVKPTPPKPHWHCVAWFDRATDYQTTVEFAVKQWATSHPQYGVCPMSYARTHEGKVLNISTWLAYVTHEPRYMAWLEEKRDKPETHKTAYKWDDIKSTDDETLNAQCLNALSWIEQTVRRMRDFAEAKERGSTATSLHAALRECANYAQMQTTFAMYRARRLDEQDAINKTYLQGPKPKQAEPQTRPKRPGKKPRQAEEVNDAAAQGGFDGGADLETFARMAQSAAEARRAGAEKRMFHVEQMSHTERKSK